MSLRLHVSAIAALGIAFLGGPTYAGEPAAKAGKSWTMPRTPDGQPDLQGYW